MEANITDTSYGFCTSPIFDDMRGQDVADRKREKDTRDAVTPSWTSIVREWSMAFVSSIWLDVIVKEDVNVCVCVWGFSEHILHPFPLSHLID